MTKEKTSQPQQSAPFDPTETWRKLTAEGVERMLAFCDELTGWESKTYERATTAAEKLTQLTSETIRYSTELMAQWRKLTLEASRRQAETFAQVSAA